MFKNASMVMFGALIGGSAVYLLTDKNMRKKTGKAMLKTMNTAEDLIAKKIN